MRKKPFLRRYTDLPVLIGILRRQEITLLPPTTWDDRNDRHLMEAYKRAKRLKTLLALCFAQVPETYHHWRVFAPGNAGVSIEFDRDELLGALPKRGFAHESMEYMSIRKLKSSRIKADRLPFIKRAAFADEKEYRIIFSSKKREMRSKNVSIDLSAVNRIAINPWLPGSLFEPTKELILSINGCDQLNVYHSRLIESPSWKRFAGKYA